MYRQRRHVPGPRAVELAQISRIMLRSIEARAEAPSIRLAIRTAARFGVSVAELVEAFHAPVLAVSPPRRGSKGASRTLLEVARREQELTVEELRMRTAEETVRTPLPPGSTAVVYVIEGSVRAAYEVTSLTLLCGQAALLSADRRFMLSATSDGGARLRS